MLLDSSVVNQTYIEDCEVCCNPIEISVLFENGNLTSLSIQSIEQ